MNHPVRLIVAGATAATDLTTLWQVLDVTPDSTLSGSYDLTTSRPADELHPLLPTITGVDFALLPAAARPRLSQPGLLLMDMDSTLIQCECIDEIADFLGIKPRISAITERAMRGELDFSASLRERVGLLAGLDAAVLERVYAERVVLTPGAERLIETLHAHGWTVGLVSGGFTFFTSRLQKRLQLDFVLANELEIADGKLTGKVLGDIVDAQSKKSALLELSAQLQLPKEQTVAMGDGANDLPMLQAAGLGVAFHAKPAVRQAASAAINFGGLDRLIDYLAE